MKPADRARALGETKEEILRFLEGRDEWVDFFDLPRLRPMGRDAARELMRSLAEDGVLELERDGTYPNMLSLRITPAGRDALRREQVREAMRYMGQGGREE